MTLGSWILSAVILWILGFWSTKRSVSSARRIRVPRWLFILCGQPISKNGIRGDVSIDGLYLQLWSLLTALYGLLLNPQLSTWAPSISVLCGMAGGFTGALIILVVLLKQQ